MRREALTCLVAAMALAGCGTSTTTAPTGTTPAATGLAPGATGTTPAPTVIPGEHKPTCYQVIFTENSGTGPTYRVRICDALLRPRPGHEWELIVDGGPLGNQAVILGQQVPR
jgi:hypothetical protein